MPTDQCDERGPARRWVTAFLAFTPYFSVHSLPGTDHRSVFAVLRLP